jgi:hypothetical protein
MGLEKHGVKPNSKSLDDDFEESGLSVFWGTAKKCTPRGRRIKELQDFLKKKNKDWITIERGYVKRQSDNELQSKDTYYSVGFNGLNGHANFKNKDMPSDRWEKLDTELQPWKSGGGNILFCGQVPWDAACEVVPNYEEWLDRTMEKVKGLTDRKIIFRPHPYLITYNPILSFTPVLDFEDKNFWREHGIAIPAQADVISTDRRASLHEEMEDAWITVSLNSNSGVESIINGIPTVACGEGSMAKEICTDLKNIESPHKPDRKQWAYNLAYSQWTTEEMKEGLTWEHLKN